MQAKLFYDYHDDEWSVYAPTNQYGPFLSDLVAALEDGDVGLVGEQAIALNRANAQPTETQILEGRALFAPYPLHRP